LKTDRGAAAVELALVLPVLLLMLFGVIDFGRMLNTQLRLTEAAREGARAAALRQPATTRVQAATSGLTGVTADVTTCPTNAVATQDAVVTVNYNFQFVTPLAAIAGVFGSGPDETFPMDARGVMPCSG
jgi:Flp pilus assembly protein TadG